MAKVFKVKSELKSDKNKHFLYSAFALFFVAVFFAAGIWTGVLILQKKTDLPMAFPCIFIALGVVMAVIYLIYRKRFFILKAGVKGEKKTLDFLEELPKSYTVITNPVIRNRGAEIELDFVVIGENGVFIVETKNYSGIIHGKTSQNSWKQIKHSKNNKVYEKEVKNPARQVARQAGKMRELLIDLDVSADVFPILFFTDSRSEIKIADDCDMNVPVFKNKAKLLEYITSAAGKRGVNSAERAKIVRLFK